MTEDRARLFQAFFETKKGKLSPMNSVELAVPVTSASTLGIIFSFFGGPEFMKYLHMDTTMIVVTKDFQKVGWEKMFQQAAGDRARTGGILPASGFEGVFYLSLHTKPVASSEDIPDQTDATVPKLIAALQESGCIQHDDSAKLLVTVKQALEQRSFIDSHVRSRKS